MSGKLAGRVALVFGAGSSGPGWGNGKAAAVRMRARARRSSAVDLDADAAAETSAIITREGGTAVAIAADVTSGAAVAEAVAQTRARVRSDRHPAQQCRRDRHGRPGDAERGALAAQPRHSTSPACS